MPGYSHATNPVFEDISLHNVRIMLELLSDAAIRDKEYLRRRYTERAQHFDATLALLKHSHIVDDHGDLIQATPDGVAKQLGGRALPELLLQRLLMANSPFRDNITSYLRQFRIFDGRPVHRPTTEQRSAESHVRNFLMELGVVSYDNVSGQYTLAADQHSLYALAVRSVAPVSPSTLQQRRRDKEDVGFAAERDIVAFEQQRLGKRYADRVCHVAATNASAGYDIESVTLESEDRLSPRFIEVKCVSLENYRFFWTANEVAMAQALGSWYYLYLLPSSGPGTLRIDMLRIICDPQVAVLNRPEQWSVEDNVLECKIRNHLE